MFRKRFMIIPFGPTIWRSGPDELPASPVGSEVTPGRMIPSLCGRRRAAARTLPSWAKSRCGGPPTASTPTTHDQPGQHSCKQPRPSGNTTSTEVSPPAATTASVVTLQSARLLQPNVIAGTKIDCTGPNRPRSIRTRHPAPDHRSASQTQWVEVPILAGPKATPGGRQPSNLALSDQSAASPG